MEESRLVPPLSDKKARQAATEELRQYLQSLSELFIGAWDGSVGPESDEVLRNHCSADFKHELPPPDFNKSMETHGVDQHIAICQKMRRENPSWRMNAYNFQASIARDMESATVWFTSGPSGSPDNERLWSTNRESAGMLKWRKRPTDGVWECYCHSSLRGGGEIVPMAPSED